ncbi:GTP-binding protein [Candidatus Uabimicrobium sp. HlEnr_7]|uniref:CobW family GTP-binding protein n=1 Tax=Candidatus Uabimicrobium helgolandensis TaxID=3095367 RepID=UPI0035580150
MKRIPVHIITGFLGSGKTTFLNHFIRERLPERIFVIENECGTINVDGALIVDSVEKVVELTAGCLCCSLADDLFSILKEVSKRIDEYDRMVIETTGIADPSSIIQAFLDNTTVEKFFKLEQVICLVDAQQIESWLKETEEALRQIALTDVLLINKIDTISPSDLKRVKYMLEGVNPHAVIYSGKQGIFPIDDILKTGTTKPISVEKITHTHKNFSKDTKGESNNHKITSFAISFPHPLDLNHLQIDLNRIVRLYRNQVYRVKGFIAIPNYPNRVILQSARSIFIVTDGTPWESLDHREGKLVFIGRGLKRETFKKMFNRHIYNL